jgi:hypothetical protein
MLLRTVNQLFLWAIYTMAVLNYQGKTNRSRANEHGDVLNPPFDHFPSGKPVSQVPTPKQAMETAAIAATRETHILAFLATG